MRRSYAAFECIGKSKRYIFVIPKRNIYSPRVLAFDDNALSNDRGGRAREREGKEQDGVPVDRKSVTLATVDYAGPTAASRRRGTARLFRETTRRR